MPQQILQSAKDYLKDNKQVELANLVRLELPGGQGTFSYYTDYKRNITYLGQEYEAGKLKSISDIQRTHKLSAYTVSIKMSGIPQDEIDRAMSSLSYLNRKISIFRVIIQSDGTLLPFYQDGTTLLMFEGKITELSADESASTSANGTSLVTWKCANEFYELDRVNGRITDDAAHRGLIVSDTGVEVPSLAAKRPEYQDDLGFFHANQSINVLAEYQTTEKRYRMEKSSSWFGLKTDYDMVEYWATVTREVDMRFNLAAKYIPTIYGVRKVDGIPVFADTLASNPRKVYVVYAFAEGEIDGFLDLWMDDKPLVCFDSTDAGDRACLGSKRDVGNTISIAAPSEGPSDPSTHGQEYVVNNGDGEARFWTFHGKSDQSAASVMVDLAATGGFYRQGVEGFGPEYWDERFKLLDTAYVVAIYDITEARNNIPKLSAEIQGKKVAVYDDNGLVSADATSSNPAWQVLDYLRSELHGVGVSLDRIDLSSFIESAELFDTIDDSYEHAWVPYWRYLNWPSNTDPNLRKIMQMNTLLATDATLFKNMDAVLQQSVSSLNVNAGLYTLSVEAEKPIIESLGIENFIDGKISVSDITSKNKYNTVGASIPDPGLGWKNNEVTFYNVDFKVEDDNVEKKSNMNFPHITNYYTARSLAERELKKSRYNREVEVTLPFQYIDLPINSPVSVTYPRFGWDEKSFLIRKTSWKSNGKVLVTLREYTDDIFVNSEQVDKGDSQVPIIGTLVKPPRDLHFTPSVLGVDPVGVNGYVEWKPSFTPDVTYYSVRVSGDLDAYVVPAEQNTDADSYFSLPLRSYPAGNYTIECRAVSGGRGLTSSPVSINITMDPAKNLPRVENLRLENTVGLGVWAGDAPIFVWDPIPDESQIAGLQYEIQIFDMSNTVLSVYTTSGTTASYLYDDNKQDYQDQNGGSVGVYRQVQCRVRAYGPNGEQSVDWIYL